MMNVLGLRLGRFLRRVWQDESGQDLLEYALLTAFVGLAGAAVWSAMDTVIGDSYTSRVDGVNLGWESPNPLGK